MVIKRTIVKMKLADYMIGACIGLFDGEVCSFLQFNM